MRHALEFVVEQGGTDIVAMGHTEVVKLYESNGLKVFTTQVFSTAKPCTSPCT